MASTWDTVGERSLGCSVASLGALELGDLFEVTASFHPEND